MAIAYHNLYPVAGSSPPRSFSPEAHATNAVAVPVRTRAEIANDCHLFGLPNELILSVLNHLTTPDLLPLASVSHRVHALVVSLLQARLTQATKSSDSLILECYPPSQKLTAPALDCIYLSTPGIEAELESSRPVGQLEHLHNLYCHYRPQRREWRRFSRPGDIPGSRTHPSSAAAQQAHWHAEREKERVKQMLSLEGHELFVQLEGNLHLMRQMGFIQNMVAVHEGYVRIWRDWLGQRANADTAVEEAVDLEVTGPSAKQASEANVAELLSATSSDHDNILWLDGTKNVGLNVTVKEKKWRRNMPVLMHADEEISVSYEVAYEELFVRTTHLVLTLEKSAQLEDTNSGKAVVFGSFR